MSISKYAHSVKNPKTIHYLRGNRYLCNRACSTTPSKSTKKWSKVTCMNCLNRRTD